MAAAIGQAMQYARQKVGEDLLTWAAQLCRVLNGHPVEAELLQEVEQGETEAPAYLVLAASLVSGVPLSVMFQQPAWLQLLKDHDELCELYEQSLLNRPDAASGQTA